MSKQVIHTKTWSEILGTPLLTEKRERDLARIIRNKKANKYRKNRAREEMALSNQKLVKKIAYKYLTFTPSLTEEDLIHTGNIGLMQAIDTYNPFKYKVRFGTFAYKLINNAVLSSLYVMGCPVTIPQNIIMQKNRYNKLKNSEQHLTDNEIQKELNVSRKQFVNIKNANQKFLSLNQPVMVNDADGLTLSEIIPSKEMAADNMLMNKDKISILKKLIDSLNEREKAIIHSLYYEVRTLSETGQKLKLSAERIRQIERIILRKMKGQIRKIIRGSKYHVAL